MPAGQPKLFALTERADRERTSVPPRIQNDINRVAQLLRALHPGQSPDEFHFVRHRGVPASQTNSSHEAHWALVGRLRLVRERMDPPAALTGNVAVAIIFFRNDHQRIDADNLTKRVLDAGTKAGLWIDDSQVTAQASIIEFDKDRPRTVIAFTRILSSLDRNRTASFVCANCGEEFTIDRFYAPHRKGMFCSVPCSQAMKRVESRCVTCNQIFERRTSGQIYCSDTCKANTPRVRRSRAMEHPWPTCIDCGAELSRRGYAKCKNCRRCGRAPGSKSRSADKRRYVELLRLTPATVPEAAAALRLPESWVRGFRHQLLNARRIRVHETLPSTGGQGGTITRVCVVGHCPIHAEGGAL